MDDLDLDRMERLPAEYISGDPRLRGSRKRHPPLSGAQTVLVRVDSVDTLRRAYPNYFADTALFLPN